jgi:hypothetical protein
VIEIRVRVDALDWGDLGAGHVGDKTPENTVIWVRFKRLATEVPGACGRGGGYSRLGGGVGLGRGGVGLVTPPFTGLAGDPNRLAWLEFG